MSALQCAFSILIAAAYLIGVPSAAIAQIELAPPTFKVGQKTAIFVDFIDAKYTLRYPADANTKTQVESTITFTNDTSGYPLFDLVPDPTALYLDGEKVTQKLIDLPGKYSSAMRMVGREVAPGTHTLKITHLRPTTTDFGGVIDDFFMGDFDDRGLLESYLPANLEFDQVKMHLHIEFAENASQQLIFTNGTVTRNEDGSLDVDYPGYFNNSSIFYHTVTADHQKLLVRQYDYPSIDGRAIPTTLYTLTGEEDTITDGEKTARAAMKELESRFGPFPHPSVTVLLTGAGGGMEYSGATVSSIYALPHELGHSYFGRGIMPANGDVGWLDEALATWSMGPYTPDKLDAKGSNMGNYSPYYRANNSLGYRHGMNFIEYLDKMLIKQHPKKNITMDTFLKAFTEATAHTTVNNAIFQSALETFHGQNLKTLFDLHVYGTSSTQTHATITAMGSSIDRLTKEQWSEIRGK